MCLGSRPSAPEVPPAPPIPELPNNTAEVQSSASRNQRIAAQRRALGTGRRRPPTLLQDDKQVTTSPVLLGR